MFEAILQTGCGPIWVFLTRLAMTLGVPVSREDIRHKLGSAGAPEEQIESAAEAALDDDESAFYYYAALALGVESGCEEGLWGALYDAYYNLSIFMARPSWGMAMKVAEALRRCVEAQQENSDLVLAAALVAASTARDIRAIAEK